MDEAENAWQRSACFGLPIFRRLYSCSVSELGAVARAISNISKDVYYSHRFCLKTQLLNVLYASVKLIFKRYPVIFVSLVREEALAEGRELIFH